ncbi:MAG: N-acetylmuramoyl-L-alanine amidase [Anaerolineae bacterium]|nr:N-acetylmuramoyl-L-alanine amidase [Anaerolineae bacterium]
MTTNQNIHFARRYFLRWSLTAGSAALLGTLVGCRQDHQTCSLDSLDIVPRADWGAAEPKIEGSAEGVYDITTNPEGWLVYNNPLEEVLTTIVVHHSALPLSDGPREIQQMHFEFKNYADIGYHFVIDEVGIIYEGRPLNVRGAHTGGRNTGTVGVVLLGNFQVDKPTSEQIETLRKLSSCLIELYGITHLAGHRSFQPGVTECPGSNLEYQLPDLATELGITFGTGGYQGQ